MDKGFHITVTGRVQGVGYRFHCRDAARKLKLRGYVMNLTDGNVEIKVYGDSTKLQQFIKDITRTDRFFKVIDMNINDLENDVSVGEFEIRFY